MAGREDRNMCAVTDTSIPRMLIVEVQTRASTTLPDKGCHPNGR
jgi:hypothetical protein